MKTAFLFVGQGQQYEGMGRDLAKQFESVKLLYEKAQLILGYDVLELSAEQLQQTVYTQPALYVLGAALDLVLKQANVYPDVVSGLSLGEYNALLSASVFDFETGLEIIKYRSHFMDTAFAPYETGMVACLKTSAAVLQSVLEGSNLEICNYNTPSLFVVGGYSKDIEKMLPIFKQEKILAILLKMSTVSHMHLLSKARDALYNVLKTVPFNSPQIPIINNANGSVQEGNFESVLADQIILPTRLSTTIETLLKDGVQQFIEVGPKGSISRYVQEMAKDYAVKIINVYDLESLKALKHDA